MTLTDSGYNQAIELLMRASSSRGFFASVHSHDNYRRVWTRDGVVNGIAALLSGRSSLIDTFRNTLDTIFSHQHPCGFIPSNVSDDGKVSYGGTAGRADNPSWAVIGLCTYTLATNDYSLADKYQAETEKCFAVMDAWEFNGKGLIYVPQSGDWADEYIYHGYVLFDQLLRVWALRSASIVFRENHWAARAEEVTAVIQQAFWNDPTASSHYAPNLGRFQSRHSSQYWTMGFNPGRVYTQFDLQANSLALLLNIGNAEQNDIVIQFIKKLINEYSSILPSFYPAVNTSDNDMRDLEENYAFSFRNLPHEFHNGGLWPVWNGFLAASLVSHNQTSLALLVTEKIHEANALREWNFNECLHGQTKAQIGVDHCTWSAGGAIIANATVLEKKIIPGLKNKSHEPN